MERQIISPRRLGGLFFTAVVATMTFLGCESSNPAPREPPARTLEAHDPRLREGEPDEDPSRQPQRVCHSGGVYGRNAIRVFWITDRNTCLAFSTSARHNRPLNPCERGRLTTSALNIPVKRPARDFTPRLLTAMSLRMPTLRRSSHRGRPSLPSLTPPMSLSPSSCTAT